MKYKHLSYSDRQEMEKLYLQGWHMNDIAAKLGVSLATVYHERARGDTGKMDKNGRGGYSAELAQSKIYARRPEGQIIRAYTPEQYKKEMARRKNATARARKLTRLQERVGAALAMLGFLMLLGAGGMCEIGQIIGYGLAGLFLFVFGVWLAHGFYGQADKAEWLRESV